jgi:preprotein translocase subunit SecB
MPCGKSVQVLVSLGTRVVEAGAEHGDEAALLFMIEADYLVEYRIKSELSGDAAKAFAHFNGVHNVWPFWRQHVFTMVEQGRLPHIDIPLFTG